ncbi:MAG: peptidylprolyl isomerase [Pseudomonadota bacterium]
MLNPIPSAALALALLWPMGALAQQGDASEPAEETPVEAPAETVEADEAPAEPDFDRDTVVAEVNGTTITLGHVIGVLNKLPEQYQQLPDEILYTSLVDQLINQQLLAQSATADGDGDHPSIAIALDNERRGILATRELQRIVGDAVTEEAVRAAYDAEIADHQPETEWNANHILVESEVAAADLRRQVVEAEPDARVALFEELAREHSTGPSGESGGELGWFGPGQMVPAFEEAASGLETGEVSAPVQTQFGWHIILLKETRDRPAPSFEERAPALAEQLRDDAIAVRIEALREAGEVTSSAESVPPSAIRQRQLLDE